MFRVGFIFGVITVFAGITGVVTGTGLAHFFKRYNKRADPLVCGVSLLLGIPFGCVALAIPHVLPVVGWILLFFAEVFLCMNWAIVADMLLYVVIPNRRSLATALQITISHLFGDAISPFIVGQVNSRISKFQNIKIPE